MSQTRVISALVAKFVKVGKVILELSLQFFRNARREMALGEGDDFCLEARGPCECISRFTGRDPFSVADEVDACGLLQESLDKGARVFFSSDEGKFDVLLDVSDELDDSVGVLNMLVMLVSCRGWTACLDGLGKGVLDKVAQEETCLVDAGLGPELGVGLLRVHNRPGLGVKVVYVLVFSLGPLCRI